MSILIETTEGNITVDLLHELEPLLCLNFLKLCEINYYFFSPFYNLHKDALVECGDPDYPEGNGGVSISKFEDIPEFHSVGTEDGYLVVDQKSSEILSDVGLVSFVSKKTEKGIVVGSQFTISLSGDESVGREFDQILTFGKIVEGFNVLEKINNTPVDDLTSKRLIKDVRITHTHVIYNPFPQAPSLEHKRNNTNTPNDTQLRNMRIPGLADEDSSETTYEALTLELLGDLPYYKMKPSPSTLFIAKLNPITTIDALSLFFSRFGEVLGCNIVADKETGKSLCYGFVKFNKKEEAEKAYEKLSDGCIIDGRDVVIDFSQSVKKL